MHNDQVNTELSLFCFFVPEKAVRATDLPIIQLPKMAFIRQKPIRCQDRCHIATKASIGSQRQDIPIFSESTAVSENANRLPN